MAATALGWLAIAPACFGKTQVRYYTLASAAAVASAQPAEPRYTVHVAPAVIPEVLDRPELVLRLSDTELAVDDNHRWAESLRTGVARAVADGLARKLDGALVSASEGRRAQPSDVELTIEVQRLDVSLARGVAVDVGWTARWADGGQIRSGRSAIRVGGGPSGGYDGAVAACAGAFDAVASEIASAVDVPHLSRR